MITKEAHAVLSLRLNFAPGFQFVAVDQNDNDTEDNAQGSNTDNALTAITTVSSETLPVTLPVTNQAYRFVTALHGMQTRSSDEKAVRLSVRLSNA